MNLILGDAIEEMAKLDAGSIDLTVTSPPYDNLRTYNGNNDQWGEHVWKEAIEQLYKVTKDGGAVVWVVGDATIKGSETGTSFKQALWAMECGFRLHDTMIWNKPNAMPLTHNRYDPCFEYMFVFSKNRPKTFNVIKEKTLHKGKIKKRELETKMSEIKGHQSRCRDEHTTAKEYKYRKNIWSYMVGVEKDRSLNKHPAIFPEQLAHDHIISWSNEGDTVFDPFMGSGTTGKMAKQLGRNFIGIELDKEYFEIAKARLST